MRHTIYRRAIAILVVLLVFAQMGQVAFSYHQKQKEAAEAGQDMEQKALTLWYTDEKLNSYLCRQRLIIKNRPAWMSHCSLCTAVDYTSISQRPYLDLGRARLFVVSSELLEKARLAGLTVENDSFTEQELSKDFPEKAMTRATCRRKADGVSFLF